jgi:phosphoribosylanthranilate isomerase
MNHSSFTPIKICGLTREEDVESAVNAGAQAIGFVLYEKSPRFVNARRAAVLAKELPAFITPVLLFVNADFDQIARACDQIPGAWIQFHGDETAEFCTNTAQGLHRKWIRAARIPRESTGEFDLVEYAQQYSSANALLLDTLSEGYGGAGHTFNWSQLPTNVNAHLVLSGGLTHANVAEGLRELRGRGRSLAVDVSSGVEIAKGIKDAGLIQSFVKAVREAPH